MHAPDESKPAFDVKAFLAKGNGGKPVAEYRKGQRIFAQGDVANTIFYAQRGKIKLTVVSNHGKEAVIAILGEGDFFGEGCLAGQSVRMATATAMTECSVMKLMKSDVVRLLHQEQS